MPTTEVLDEMLIDRALPLFDATRIEHLVVDAEPQAAYAAIRSVDFMQVHTPLMDAAMWLRGAPIKLAHAIRGSGQPEPEIVSLTFDGMADGTAMPGWMLLGEDPPREVAFGGIGKFWRPDIEWLPEMPKDFASFDEPGWGKIAANMSVRRYGLGRSLVSYEARTRVADPEARKKFMRYWTAVDPFVGVIMRATLRSIAIDAV
jgi:hypothetical protein